MIATANCGWFVTVLATASTSPSDAPGSTSKTARTLLGHSEQVVLRFYARATG
jgi:hypothetical protein